MGYTRRDRQDGGMGVGLTLVRMLVALHGGTVSARSTRLLSRRAAAEPTSSRSC